MKKITLNDSFRVSDSKIHGVVVIKENGKIIIKKENMIVGNGRSYIKNLLSSKIFPLTTTEDRKINSIKFGTVNTKTVVTSEDLNLEDAKVTLDGTSMGWKKIPVIKGNSGSSFPSPVIQGDYFLYVEASETTELKIGGTTS
jgi:hypothetical protein